MDIFQNIEIYDYIDNIIHSQLEIKEKFSIIMDIISENNIQFDKIFIKEVIIKFITKIYEDISINRIEIISGLINTNLDDSYKLFILSSLLNNIYHNSQLRVKSLKEYMIIYFTKYINLSNLFDLPIENDDQEQILLRKIICIYNKINIYNTRNNICNKVNCIQNKKDNLEIKKKILDVSINNYLELIIYLEEEIENIPIESIKKIFNNIYNHIK